MTKITWSTEVRKVKDLILWDKNPREITKTAFKRLLDKIKRFGFHSVIVIDIDNTILSGNQRKKALEKLGKVQNSAI